MGNDTTVANLSSDQPAAGKEDMAENMSMADYMAQDRKRREPAKEAAPEPKDEDEKSGTDNAEGEQDASPEAEATEEAQSKEHETEADPETEDVLSKFHPKAKEQINKRIGVLTARAKEAEEKAKTEAAEKAQMSVELERLRANAQQAAPAIPVTVSDNPDDMTAKATSHEQIEAVESNARKTLELIEENEHLIQRAIARDEQTVTLSDGNSYNVDSIPKARRQAKAHIEKFVPARKAYLQQRTAAVEAARGKFPALFKPDTQEHLALQSAIQQSPALRSVPNVELLYGYALRGLAAERAEQEAATKKAKVEPASSRPAKASADVPAAGTPRKESSGSTAKRDLEAKLAKAEKEMEKSGSMEAFTEINRLRSRIKSL